MSDQTSKLFARIKERLERKTAELPEVIGNEIVNYALDAFDKQAWEGQQWDKRKSKKDPSRALLIKSGILRRSIRVVRTTATGGSVGTDVPYARIHNEGGEINKPARKEDFVRNRYKRGPKSKLFGGLGAFQKGTTPGQGLSFKAYSINMPARPFLKNTPKLRAYLREKAIEHIRSK